LQQFSDIDSGRSEKQEPLLKKRKRETKTDAEIVEVGSHPVYDGKYRNKQRCLVFCSRGIIPRYRHLMEDFRKLLPHHKKEVKLDAKGKIQQDVNEICETKSCNTCLFFETRKRKDLYLWAASTPNGPSIKFHVFNIHTMEELKLTGNSLMGSRPILSFDGPFDQVPHLKLVKSTFSQIFGTPRGHPKSKPFIDRIMSFHWIDEKVWIRNWQIVDDAKTKSLEKKAEYKGEDLCQLVEIGPRAVLDIIRIFGGSFGGPTLFQNPEYASPNEIRRAAHNAKHTKYSSRVKAKKDAMERSNKIVREHDHLSDIFK